ncbi:MAG: 30S ribosomal protein S15 [Puniceicoccales bacterium]|jgi:small subunit ribosomal protein S15|nr:30S ribosomal protein S15 [Puniceicoccales bacterium]
MDKSEIIDKFKRCAEDAGSCEVQIALLTERIKHLTEHLGVHVKDLHSRRGLVALSNRRKRLLSYLKRVNVESYKNLIKCLNLRK